MVSLNANKQICSDGCSAAYNEAPRKVSQLVEVLCGPQVTVACLTDRSWMSLEHINFRMAWVVKG